MQYTQINPMEDIPLTIQSMETNQLILNEVKSIIDEIGGLC